MKIKKKSKKDKGDDEKSAKLKKKSKKDKGKKSKDEDDEKPAKAKRKPPVNNTPKDAWGTRQGTRTARINSVLMKASKALSTAQIEEKADATSIHSHLSKLMSEEKIQKVEGGKYEMTKKGRKLAGK